VIPKRGNRFSDKITRKRKPSEAMRLTSLAVLAVALAGCASQPTVTGAPAAGTPYGAPPEPMAGRWQLAAAGASPCVMNFGGTPEAGEGTIAPEGGCPGNFYTSRKWTFEQGSLVIRDHNGQPLGQLALASPGRFDGKAANGQQVTLTR
jgi:Protease inhibitor Inh